MDIHQTATLEQNAPYSALVAQKSDLLNNVIDLATTEGIWELTEDDRGRRLLRLQLKDQFNGQCTGEFAPEELKNAVHLTSRFHALKGALLRVGHWRSQLQQLFDNIRQWCHNLPGGAAIQEEPIVVREERSGEYMVSRLTITSKGQTMRVEPVAAWVVGADGRVDLKGTGGPFILLYSQQDDSWSYFQNNYPTAASPLTEVLFLQLAEACLHG